MGLIAEVGLLSNLAYEIAEGRGSWRDFVVEAGRVFDTVHAVLTTETPDRGSGGAEGNAHVWARYNCGSYRGQDLLMERAWRLPRGQISLVQRVDDIPSFTSSSFYSDFLDKSGLRHFVHVLLPEGPGAVAFFCLTRDAGQREFSREEIEAVEALMPHLTRALRLARRGLSTQHPDTLFQNCGFGLVLFDSDGRVAARNSIARRLIETAEGLRVEGERLFIAGVTGDIGALANRVGRERSGPLPIDIENIGSGRKVAGALTPVPAEWVEIGATPATAMLVLSDLHNSRFPDAATLAEHLGLTIREAHFAQALVQSRGLKAAGEQLGIAQETARRHLKSIFEKTGTHSQSDLIHLLARHPAGFLSSPN